MQKPPIPSHINKLIILFLLDNSSVILSEFQIIRALRDLNLMPYFDLMQYLYESERDGLIVSKPSINGTKYKITERGSNTLAELKKEIDLTVRESIKKYLKENKQSLEDESQFTGEYVKIANREYKVILRILEKDSVLYELNFTTVNIEEARSAVENWPIYAVELYKNTIDLLLTKNELSNNFESK